MCAREDIDYQGQELKSSIAKVESKLECVQRKLDALLEKLGEGERNKWRTFSKGGAMKCNEQRHGEKRRLLCVWWKLSSITKGLAMCSLEAHYVYK